MTKLDELKAKVEAARKDLTALKCSIEGIDVENTSPLDVAHVLYNLANDAQVILNDFVGITALLSEVEA